MFELIYLNNGLFIYIAYIMPQWKILSHFQSTNSHKKLFTQFCFATLLLLFSWEKFASHVGKYSLLSINAQVSLLSLITRFRRFGTADKMILSSTVLSILIFARLNVDAQRCNRWNTCYEKIQTQENSALETINRTLSTQIELLKNEKSNSFINYVSI